VLINSNDLDAIKIDLRQAIATGLGVSPEHVEITAITKGSVIIAFTVDWPATTSVAMAAEIFTTYSEAIDKGIATITVANFQGVDQVISVVKMGLVSHKESASSCLVVTMCRCPAGNIARLEVNSNRCTTCFCDDTGAETPSRSTNMAYLWGPLGALITVIVVISGLAIFYFSRRKSASQSSSNRDEMAVGEIVSVPQFPDSPDSRQRAARVILQAARDSLARSTSKTSTLRRTSDPLRGQLEQHRQHLDAIYVGDDTNFRTPASSAAQADTGEYLDANNLTTGIERGASYDCSASTLPYSLGTTQMSLSLPSLLGLGQGEYFESVGGAISSAPRLSCSTPSLDEPHSPKSARWSRSLFQHEDQTRIDMDDWILSGVGEQHSPPAWATWETPDPVPVMTTVRRTSETLTFQTGSISSLPDSIPSSVTSSTVNGSPMMNNRRTKRKKGKAVSIV